MSAHLRPMDEERSLEDGDRAQKHLDIIKEFKHTEAGVWDIYEQIPHRKFDVGIPMISALPYYADITEDLPFVWRMVKDVIKIESCSYYLCLLIMVEFLASLVPAVSLWFTSYYFTFIRAVMDERRIDGKLLIFASAGRICCDLARTFLTYWAGEFALPLNLLIRERFEKEMFGAIADLDVPTHDDKVVRSRLNDILRGGYGFVWGSLRGVLGLFYSIVHFATELGVVVKVISHQPGGVTFAIVSFGQEVFELLDTQGTLYRRVLIAITNNEHYIKLAGLEALVNAFTYRQEIVAGNLANFLKTAYNQAYAHVSGKRAQPSEYPGPLRASCLRLLVSRLIPTSIGEVAEMVYLFKSATHPETIPTCLAIIRFVHTTRRALKDQLWAFPHLVRSIKEQCHTTRAFYEIRETQNKVPDGATSFPEDNRSPESGITVEFRNVSFRYPDREDFALRNVSFKVEKGQLCVIVGKNGSGKSTVLKLILRLYDPTEGTILINGQDVKTLKLADLRESTAMLFQNYTHFPLSIKDNIALGGPKSADDEAKFREAARMTGADEFIHKMAKGFNTYLQNPILNHWVIPSKAKTKSGKKIDRDLFCEAIGCVVDDAAMKLAGGQLQRLAVSRMLMRSILSDEARVRLLLLDEPSAALDPEAEQDLFARFRKLRGEKTMIFSSHRFGQLTKPADLILYMRDSTIVESGTHEELMTREGKYAELWKLQAEAFL